MFNNILRYFYTFAGGYIYQYKIKPAVAAGFAGGLVEYFEMYLALFFVNSFYAGAYQEIVVHFKGTLVAHINTAYQPAVATLQEFIHTHAVKTFHLVVTGSHYV